jgi:F-type H+-transporting ATPase subunit beta
MSDVSISVGDGLLGRAIDAAGTPIDELGPLADVRPATLAAAANGAGAMVPWETGIKVIDFYAPIARGLTVALVASPGVGLGVCAKELIHRSAEQFGGCAVLAELEGENQEVQAVRLQLRETGVERVSTLLAGRMDDPPAEKQRLVSAALAIAEDFVARGRDVLLVLDDGLAIAETADLLRGRARALERGSLTLLPAFWRHTTAEPMETPVLQKADARLVLSKELALQGIWPAVDALASRSRLLDERQVSAEHLRVIEAARELLRLGEHAPDAVQRERARKLLLFQAQPFFVAEPFTARPGEYVPLEDSVRAFGGIIAGEYDATPEEALRFIGGVRRPTLT